MFYLHLKARGTAEHHDRSKPRLKVSRQGWLLAEERRYLYCLTEARCIRVSDRFRSVSGELTRRTSFVGGVPRKVDFVHPELFLLSAWAAEEVVFSLAAIIPSAVGTIRSEINIMIMAYRWSQS